MRDWFWNRRQRLLADLRAQWGGPVTRERRMDAIAAYHKTRVEAEHIESIDHGAPPSLIRRALARAAELDRQRGITGTNPLASQPRQPS